MQVKEADTRPVSVPVAGPARLVVVHVLQQQVTLLTHNDDGSPNGMQQFTV